VIVLLALLATGLSIVLNSRPPAEVIVPSAAQLLRLLNICRQVSTGLYRTDGDQPPSVPICQLDGAIFWQADMDIDCDGQITSVCNANTDPWFQADTTVHTASGQALDSAALPYVVLPAEGSNFQYSSFGIAPGAVVAVVYNGQVRYGVFGDTGPAGIIGEASYAMAQSLGIDPDPASGGADSGVSYIVFQNTVVSAIEDHSRAVSIGEQSARRLIERYSARQ
jgi:glycosyl hydrolase group 75 (putative chitosanase)